MLLNILNSSSLYIIYIYLEASYWDNIAFDINVRLSEFDDEIITSNLK